MGWRGRGGGRTGLWPGRGPFSYLPPWQRPGWIYGRGACWWLLAPQLQTGVPQVPVPSGSTTPVPSTVPIAPFVPPITKDQEKQVLEQQVQVFEAQLDAVKKRLNELSQ